MRASSIVGLLFAAMMLAMIPVSPQVTPRGVELSIDQAQAITYRRAAFGGNHDGRHDAQSRGRAVRHGVY
jgi:hypothetical protein